ncbi:MAG: hypothetical protein KUG82_05860 [Pseudomonadales bacterium]|nr:hypothetical protein [Pseudomonadales bacterium]
MTSAKYLISYAFGSLLLLSAIATFNFGIDPYQLYRTSNKPVYFDNQRYQLPGLAKNYHYDTVVVGTSMTENFYPSYIDNAFQGKTLKLSIQGSTSKEQWLILDKAIQSGQVKNVIWGLDLNSFSQGPDYTIPGFPLHMYQEGPTLLINYLLSMDSIALSVKSLLGMGEINLETLNTWDNLYEFSERRVMQQWRMFRNFGLDGKPLTNNGSPADITPVSKSNSQWIIDAVHTNLKTIIENNQNTHFYLYYPPRSILYHTLRNYLELDYLSSLELFMRTIYESIAHYDNVGIYDFQSDENIIFDFNLYKDTEHHNVQINERIISAFTAGRNKVSQQHYHQHIRSLRHTLSEYQNTVCNNASDRSELCLRKSTAETDSQRLESLTLKSLILKSQAEETTRLLQNVETGYQGWTPLNQSSIQLIEGILTIDATGTDPSVAIPYQVQHGTAIAIKLEISSPRDTQLELFYQTKEDTHYSANRRITKAIQTGDNTVVLDLSEYEIAGQLRFDPGSGPGEYAIKSFEIIALP